MKTLFIPLDERPCNYQYPQMIAQTSDIELIIPSIEQLSVQKTPADTSSLWQFVESHIHSVDNVIFSVDMMMYGGLIPSRLHYLSATQAQVFEDKVRYLKALNPKVKIYAYNCIMRCPSYSSSDEEPDYYDQYGYEIFKCCYLQDKQQRDTLTTEEAEELSRIASVVPRSVLDDFESRRQFNSDVNLRVASLVKDKVIDFLVIPQDDSSPFGYTANDQKKVIHYIEQQGLSFDIAIYPGADEVGVTLLSRAYNEFHQRVPKIYPFYSSTLGPQIVPLYEDRAMNESVKAHIRAAGGQWCDNSQQADFILAINSPGKKMQEAAQQYHKDLSYSSGRNLQDFVLRIEDYLQQGKPVILADSAFANGGDIQLIQFLNQHQLLNQLASYKGWNTNCNTLGTTLGAGMIADMNNPKTLENIAYHVLEDVAYQAAARTKALEVFFADAAFGHTRYQPEQLTEAMSLVKDELLNFYHKNTAQSLPQDIEFDVNSPWGRTFEIGITINKLT